MSYRSVTSEFSAIHTFLRDCLDIVQDEEKLRYCYSDTYSREIEENIIAAYAYNIPAIAFNDENEIVRDFMLDNAENFSDSLNISPIFFYAHIGQGKTTYLQHFIKIRVKEERRFRYLDKKVYFIYIPFTEDDDQCSFTKKRFGDELTLVFEDMLKTNNVLEDYDVLSDLFPALASEYKRRSDNDPEKLKGFIIDKSNWNEYLQKWITWFNENKKIKVCCILDNIDQHFNLIHDVNYFYRLFQNIMSYKTQLIIPLRISNHGFLNNNFFDAINPIPITLSLPNFGELIEKRLGFIERHFAEKLERPIFKIGNTSITTNEIFTKFHSITKIILTHKEVKRSLELLSNYNSRSFLKIIVNSFSSKSLFCHPLSGEEINYSERVSKGKFHSIFLYSLMLRDSDYYYEEGDKTPIINLFSNNAINNWNAFIKYHMLKFIERYNRNEVSFNVFCNAFMREYNLEKSAIKKAIECFIQKKCVVYRTSSGMESKNIKKMVDEEDFFITISPRGQFHLTIVKELEYYEILAIPDLVNSTNRPPMETSKKERAENLFHFLEKMKTDEYCVKSILRDEEKVKEYLIWTNEILPSLWNDYKKIFSEYHFADNIM